MKRLTTAASLLSVLSVWIVLLPMRFIYCQFPPEQTIRSFERFGSTLPSTSEFLLHHMTMGKFYLAGYLLSAAIIGLGVKATRNPKLLAGQVGIVAGWCCVVAATLLCFFMPLFKMGEVVCGGERVAAKSEFTQITFIVDSLYSAPQQMFLQRGGDEEVPIPREERERWVNVEVASGTNRAFCMVYVDEPQSTNTTADNAIRWQVSRVVELSLPMTNQPLESYALRTLWTCNPKVDKWRPRSIASTWDGKHLMVYSTPYESRTNNTWPKATTYLFDVEQSQFMNVPPAAQ